MNKAVNMRNVILNVLIGGVSIGMTFSPREAQQWMNSSHSSLKKEVLPVPYLDYSDRV